MLGPSYKEYEKLILTEGEKGVKKKKEKKKQTLCHGKIQLT